MIFLLFSNTVNVAEFELSLFVNKVDISKKRYSVPPIPGLPDSISLQSTCDIRELSKP